MRTGETSQHAAIHLDFSETEYSAKLALKDSPIVNYESRKKLIKWGNPGLRLFHEWCRASAHSGILCDFALGL